MPRLLAVLLLAGLLAIPSPARAAESYDSCAGYIDSLPATISQQGVWCLRKNLSTNISTGNAIEIAANNVTIDCNDFKIGGLAAGNGSLTIGIHADNRQNATVRNCNIRGFYSGIYLTGVSGAGHLVEDNRLDNNLYYGIYVQGENNRVRRNAVYDTGGAAGRDSALGIEAGADISDNTVSGLFAEVVGGALTGIIARNMGANVRDNKVSGFSVMPGGGIPDANGIWLSSSRQRASGNQVVGGFFTNISGIGIATSNSWSYCRGNDVGGFTTNIDSDCISSDNLISP